MYPEMVLIRGLPGSGKSTLAKRNFSNYEHVEADMFFVNKEGEYVYDQTKIREAHTWCQDKVWSNLRAGKCVVVTNTFTRFSEMSPYMKMGYPVTIIIATGNYKNTHGVPEPVIEKMRKRFEYVLPANQSKQVAQHK